MGKTHLREFCGRLAALAGAALTAFALTSAGELNASAATYSTVDAFAKTSTIKGMQGVSSTTAGTTTEGVEHSLRNCVINDCFYTADDEYVQKGYVAPFVYEGETYYFGAPNIFDWLKICNRNGITTSVVFLIEYDEDTLYLIDENARESGHNYYMPATSGDAGKRLEAFSRPPCRCSSSCPAY